MEENNHSGHRQRLKNRVKKFGLKSLEPHEVLEVLLTYSIPRKNTNDIAHALLKDFPTIADVIDAKSSQLKLVNGVGEETILFFDILKNFVDIYLEAKTNNKIVKLDTAAKCINYIKSHFQPKNVECLYILCLTKTNTLSHHYMVEGESEQEVELSVKSFADNIVMDKVKKVVVVHTHTSQDLTPSTKDIQTTDRINGICTLMGVEFLDHIILNSNSYFSFNQSGFIRPLTMEEANKIIQSYDTILKSKRK